MVQRKMEISGIKIIHMDRFRGLLDIRRLNRIPNHMLRVFYDLKGVDEKTKD